MHFFLGNRKLVKADEDSAAEGLEGLAKAVDSGMSADNISSGIKTSSVRLGDQQELYTAFGNSITEQNFGFSKWFSMESDGKLFYLTNAGVGGDTTQDMLDRLDDVPENTTLVTVMEGTNDTGIPISAAAHAVNMKAILVEMISRGIKPILVLAPPRSDDEQTLLLSDMNIYDWKTALDLGVECYQPWDQYSDGFGHWADGADSDDTHPTIATAKGAGVKLHEQFSNKTTSLPLNRNNNYGLIANPLFMDDSNADGVPDSFTLVGANSSATLSETSLGVGNTYAMTATQFNYTQSHIINVDTDVDYMFACKLALLFTIAGDASVDFYFQGVNTSTRTYILDDITVDVDSKLVTQECIFDDDEQRLIISTRGTTGTFEVTSSLAQLTLFAINEYTTPSGAEYTANGEAKYLP